MTLRSGTSEPAALYQHGRERSVAPPHGVVNSTVRQALPVFHGNGPYTLTIHHSFDTVAEDWHNLERSGVSTLYQSFLWCSTWQETCGKALGTSVRIALFTAPDGSLLAILPFQIRRQYGIRVLEWLGSPHTGYGYGLFSASALADADVWAPAALADALDAIGGIDAVRLSDMPAKMFGAAHPLSHAFNLASANVSFCMTLDRDFDRLYGRKRDAEDRRAARKKEENLSKLGALDFGLPAGRAAIRDTLDTMFAHQRARMAELGVHEVSTPPEQAFFHRLAERQDEEEPILLPYRFTRDGEPLAIMMGGLHAGTFWALISSLSPDAPRKYSPGDLALRKTIAACCAAEFSRLDFSAGDSAYKRAWADDIIPLYHHLSARTIPGLAYAAAAALRIAIKRFVKTRPALFSASLAVRRALLGKRGARST